MTTETREPVSPSAIFVEEILSPGKSAKLIAPDTRHNTLTEIRNRIAELEYPEGIMSLSIILKRLATNSLSWTPTVREASLVVLPYLAAKIAKQPDTTDTSQSQILLDIYLNTAPLASQLSSHTFMQIKSMMDAGKILIPYISMSGRNQISKDILPDFISRIKEMPQEQQYYSHNEIKDFHKALHNPFTILSIPEEQDQMPEDQEEINPKRKRRPEGRHRQKETLPTQNDSYIKEEFNNRTDNIEIFLKETLFDSKKRENLMKTWPSSAIEIQQKINAFEDLEMEHLLDLLLNGLATSDHQWTSNSRKAGLKILTLIDFKRIRNPVNCYDKPSTRILDIYYTAYARLETQLDTLDPLSCTLKREKYLLLIYH